MRKLLDITIFLTPIDPVEESIQKSESVKQMMKDYIDNSGDIFVCEDEEKNLYKSLTFSNTLCQFSYAEKTPAWENLRDPWIIFSASFDTEKVEHDIIEWVLDDTIRFFAWVFRDEYFIDYESSYRLSAMNAWKKYALDDISSIDITNRKSKENKKLLDSLLYLHYTLERDLVSLGISHIQIEVLLESKKIEWPLVKNLTVSKIKNQELTDSLLRNIHILRSQIDIVLHYFLTS